LEAHGSVYRTDWEVQVWRGILTTTRAAQHAACCACAQRHIHQTKPPQLHPHHLHSRQFCAKLQKRFLEHPVTETKNDKVRKRKRGGALYDAAPTTPKKHNAPLPPQTPLRHTPKPATAPNTKTAERARGAGRHPRRRARARRRPAARIRVPQRVPQVPVARGALARRPARDAAAADGACVCVEGGQQLHCGAIEFGEPAEAAEADMFLTTFAPANLLSTNKTLNGQPARRRALARARVYARVHQRVPARDAAQVPAVQEPRAGVGVRVGGGRCFWTQGAEARFETPAGRKRQPNY
jgi:hypothetical protein